MIAIIASKVGAAAAAQRNKAAMTTARAVMVLEQMGTRWFCSLAEFLKMLLDR